VGETHGKGRPVKFDPCGVERPFRSLSVGFTYG